MLFILCAFWMGATPSIEEIESSMVRHRLGCQPGQVVFTTRIEEFGEKARVVEERLRLTQAGEKIRLDFEYRSDGQVYRRGQRLRTPVLDVRYPWPMVDGENLMVWIDSTEDGQDLEKSDAIFGMDVVGLPFSHSELAGITIESFLRKPGITESKVQEEQINGERVFHVRQKMNTPLVSGFERQFWVAPDRDYVMTAYEAAGQSEKWSSSLKVRFDHQRAQPSGKWITKSFELNGFVLDKLFRNIQMRVEEVTIGTPFPESAFALSSLDVPQGTVVWKDSGRYVWDHGALLSSTSLPPLLEEAGTPSWSWSYVIVGMMAISLSILVIYRRLLQGKG